MLKNYIANTTSSFFIQLRWNNLKVLISSTILKVSSLFRIS